MTFRVDLERDEAGCWVATIGELHACHTQGRSIRQALARVREALSLCVPDEQARTADLVPRVHLPTEARRVIGRYDSACKKLERDQEAARDAANEAVDVLTRKLGLSVRDAADVLGLSHQRVHQLTRRG